LGPVWPTDSWVRAVEKRVLITWRHGEVNMSAVPDGIASADVIVWGEGDTFAQQIVTGRHRLKSDEPVSVGGTDTGPSPYDFLLTALGSCTSMTVGMYARKKNWPLERVTVWLRHSKTYAADCSECETREGMLDRIERDVRFEGPLAQNSTRGCSKLPTCVQCTERLLRKSTFEPNSCDSRASSSHPFC
jgi:uncharacterized OsmC-like protein